MTVDRWEKAKEIFGRAIEMEAPEREAYVRGASGGDQDVFGEVMSLLREDSSGVLPENPLLPPSGSEALLKGRYQIGRELGRGGLGVVYLAFDEHLHHRPVVVKMPLDFGASTTWPAAKFAEEVKALALIDHPGVVGALDAGITPEGRPFFVMQFVEGQSLRATIPSAGLPFERVAQIVSQIGHALAAAHSKRVWHRDLKPDNIMLQELAEGGEHVRIIDFGIATVRDAQAKNGEVSTRVIGSPGYMAPEQLEGRVSAATDIYAFGVVAYEMVTGRKPFIADNPVQLLAMQKAGVLDKPSKSRPELLPEAEKLILQALSERPEDRPANAAAFGEDLAKALMAGEVHLSPTRNRTSPVLALLATLLVVVGATFWWGMNRAAASARAINCSILIQSMRDGQPAGMPELAPFGQPLRTSDNFIVLVRPAQAGHIYVLSEEGDDNLNVLFPSPTMYQGSSGLEANEQRRIPERSWFGFDPEPATLTLWFFWSEDKVDELEQLGRWINEQDRGAVRDPLVRARVQHLLVGAALKNPSAPQGCTDETVRTSLRRFAWNIRLRTEAARGRRLLPDLDFDGS